MSPLCESFVPPERANAMEPFFPLHARVCDGCRLVQLEAYVTPDEIFTEYAYFSSFSTSWVEHARAYVEMIVQRLSLDDTSLVVELASNDGYLLKHFIGTGVRILGIEPARTSPRSRLLAGVPTLTKFFGTQIVDEVVAAHGQADLVIGNNVLAHVPDLNDFVAGVAALLAPTGTVTFEFPHLLRLMEGLQNDTIYHEHFCYFSLETTVGLMRAHGLDVYDVEELSTHGGSLRVYICHHDALAVAPAVAALIDTEHAAGLDDLRSYEEFGERVDESKRQLLEVLIGLRRDGKRIAGYGAPGKGNTLLNYCGIRTDFIEYTVDRNPYKHGMFLPGTRIPIHRPRADCGDEARCRRRAALEPDRRDLAATRLCRRVGWEARSFRFPTRA